MPFLHNTAGFTFVSVIPQWQWQLNFTKEIPFCQKHIGKKNIAI